jgi:purine nucleoside permease
LGDLLAVSIPTPGLNMRFPHVRCVEDYSVCQLTTGEGEINAAATIMALVLSTRFDLQKSYFLISGIAGVNPKYGTLGSVALAKYTIQVALQYEFDAREMPAYLATGYLPFGVNHPSDYPRILYGTEVFELNENLRDMAYEFATKANLSDSQHTSEYRSKYQSLGSEYSMATKAPSVIRCDATTSDVYYSGRLLSEAFENTTRIWTNGSGIYCMTAQEDNATLEIMVRAAIEGLVDFARIIVVRAGR